MPSPIRDWKAVERLSKLLAAKQLSVYDIMSRFQISERTAYRWLEALKVAGADLVERRERKGRRTRVLYSIHT